MNKLGAGISLIILGGIMRSVKILAAAIYMSGSASQSRELFEAGMDYVGMNQDLFAVIAVLCGAVLIFIYFRDSYRKK